MVKSGKQNNWLDKTAKYTALFFLKQYKITTQMDKIQ